MADRKRVTVEMSDEEYETLNRIGAVAEVNVPGIIRLALFKRDMFEFIENKSKKVNGEIYLSKNNCGFAEREVAE